MFGGKGAFIYRIMEHILASQRMPFFVLCLVDEVEVDTGPFVLIGFGGV